MCVAGVYLDETRILSRKVPVILCLLMKEDNPVVLQLWPCWDS